MMVNLPQELLETIIYELDYAALKCCSLAASRLRQPCQRLLLHKLHLFYDNIPAISLLLRESPHISHYVHSLHVSLSRMLYKSTDTLHILQLALSQLDGIDQCTIDGWHPTWLTKEMGSGALDPLWAFVKTHSSKELHLRALAPVPMQLFSDFLGATQSIHLDGVSITRLEQQDIPPEPIRKPVIRRIYLGRGCLPVFETLALTPLSIHLSFVQHLTLFVSGANYSNCMEIIMRCKGTLQFLHLHPLNIHIDSVSLPALPALRQVEFAFDNSSRVDGGHWLALVLPSLLSPPSEQSPSLKEIGIFFEWSFKPSELDAILQRETLVAMDSMLSEHPSRPSISWAIPENCVSEFEVKIGSHMPLSNGRGSLLIRSWSEPESATKS
ncbi:Peroxidase [Mycena indigotica]|uniref:Peroxidase n=1 Tax=Mycena indigotica TaxID=2126181 RepID=A0A8H6SS74_9AGAR|nr:Peroxidase [Mycena indigotica]KAF7303922.1 Peroxidase [Mycena indigotica]